MDQNLKSTIPGRPNPTIHTEEAIKLAEDCISKAHNLLNHICGQPQNTLVASPPVIADGLTAKTSDLRTKVDCLRALLCEITQELGAN